MANTAVVGQVERGTLAVAHGIGVVDDGDERLGRQCIGGVGLIDDVTLLGAGGERQHGREYQDNFLHYTEVMTKKIGHSFHCVGII